ncbi:MAG: hypothetical protein ACK5NK_13605 [Niabella sp.]
MSPFQQIPRINTPGGGSANIPGSTKIPTYYNYGSANPNANMKVTVVLKNDSIVSGKGTISYKYDGFQLKFKSNKSKSWISPAETKEIYRLMPEGDTVKGIVYKDSCWLFHAIKGKINGYTFTSLSENLDLYVIEYDGKFIKADRDVVRDLVKSNLKAEQKAKKGQLAKALLIYNKDNADNSAAPITNQKE